MTDETSKKIEECSCDAVTEKPVETPKVEAPAQVPATPSVDLTPITTSLSGLTEKLASLEAKMGIREAPKPEAQVSAEPTTLTIGQIAEKMRKAFDDGRDFKVSMPYSEVRNFAVMLSNTGTGVRESMRNSLDKRIKIQEAYTLSGTHTAIDQVPGVQTVPGGVDQVPVRQYTNFKQVEKGKDSATFYKKTLPNVVSQTVGTTATQSSLTVTAVNIQPSTIAGVYLKVDSDDEEDVPYNLAGELVDAISQVVVDYENDAILNTAVAQGTWTPGLWVNGNTGATITHSDIASMTADPSAIGKGMAYLNRQGYTKFGKAVCFMHPNNVDQLIRDGDLSSYVQFGQSNITTSGMFPELYGATIIPTQSVEAYDNTTNDVYNAVLCIPSLLLGSAAKRSVNFKFHDIPEDNQVGVTANWRFKAGVIDASAGVRISCAQ
jgi:hypothetical protein